MNCTLTTQDALNNLEKRVSINIISLYIIMKLPIDFDQFKSDPLKAIMFLLLCVVSILYYRTESQSKGINERCEARLELCEQKLERLSAQLKTQDSLCSGLITEITLYKKLGKI